MSSPIPMQSSTTCGGVWGVRTISKRGITWAGEKKWAPTIRLGCFILAAHVRMLMVEVLEDSTHSSEQTTSSSWKIFCFRGMSSMTASITMSALPKSLRSKTPFTRPRTWSAFSCVSLPLLTMLCTLLRMRPSPPSRNCWLTSFSRTCTPARTSAVAIPEPMRPPPSTATRRMGRGARPTSVTPCTFLVAPFARKTCTSALPTSVCTQ
mmetsp:Transcript_33969/g.47060  ORF Transcript_33969/g.47060 Transcript_33969/m.47060 type:complete len:208 (-) Transcript_33969:949-1572(-)